MTTFQQRHQVGELGQKHLAEHLTQLGFFVFLTGQEHWLSTIVHQAIRFNHDDPMARAVRYMPDLLAWHPDFPLAYWEAKVNSTPGTSNFAIEKSCFDEAMARIGKGERVIIAFMEVDRIWHANHAQNLLVVRDMSSQRHLARGSHTPYLLIAKTSTMPLTNFLKK